MNIHTTETNCTHKDHKGKLERKYDLANSACSEPFLLWCFENKVKTKCKMFAYFCFYLTPLGWKKERMIWCQKKASTRNIRINEGNNANACGWVYIGLNKCCNVITADDSFTFHWHDKHKHLLLAKQFKEEIHFYINAHHQYFMRSMVMRCHL